MDTVPSMVSPSQALPVDVLSVVMGFLSSEDDTGASGVCRRWNQTRSRHTAVLCVTPAVDWAEWDAALSATTERLAGWSAPGRLCVGGWVPSAGLRPHSVDHDGWNPSSCRFFQSLAAVASRNLFRVREWSVNGGMWPGIAPGWDPILHAAGDAERTPALRGVRFRLSGRQRSLAAVDRLCERIRRRRFDFLHLQLDRFSERDALRSLRTAVRAGGAARLIVDVRRPVGPCVDWSVELMMCSSVRADAGDGVGADADTGPADRCSVLDLTLTLPHTERFTVDRVPVVAAAGSLDRLYVTVENGGEEDATDENTYALPLKGRMVLAATHTFTLTVLRLRLVGITGLASHDVRRLCDWAYALPRLVEFRCDARRNPLCDRAFGDDDHRRPVSGHHHPLRRWYVRASEHPPRLTAAAAARTVDRMRRRFAQLTDARFELEPGSGESRRDFVESRRRADATRGV